MTYQIVGFNSANSNITLLVNGKQINFSLPIVDGLYPEGDALVSLLTTYANNVGVQQVSDTASNSASIQSLVTSLPDSIIATQARAKRNGLLRQSDWSQLPDANVDKAIWATYRQALRDLPSQKDFPNIEMPTKPL